MAVATSLERSATIAIPVTVVVGVTITVPAASKLNCSKATASNRYTSLESLLTGSERFHLCQRIQQLIGDFVVTITHRSRTGIGTSHHDGGENKSEQVLLELHGEGEMFKYGVLRKCSLSGAEV
jgi:hypothetical protein